MTPWVVGAGSWLRLLSGLSSALEALSTGMWGLLGWGCDGPGALAETLTGALAGGFTEKLTEALAVLLTEKLVGPLTEKLNETSSEPLAALSTE